MTTKLTALHAAVTALEQLWTSHEMGRMADAGFDGGEWSGPAHDDAEAQAEETITRSAGYGSVEALWEAAALAGLVPADCSDPDDETACRLCGRPRLENTDGTFDDYCQFHFDERTQAEHDNRFGC